MIKKLAITGFFVIFIISQSNVFAKDENNKKNNLQSKNVATKKNNNKKNKDNWKFSNVMSLLKVKKDKLGEDRASKRALWRQDRIRREKEADLQRKLRKDKDIAKKNMQVVARQKAMKKWKIINKNEVASDYVDGRYADLFVRPNWPFYMLYSENTNLLNIDSEYNYATNCYNSKGSTQDLSALAFGEQSFTFSDILLALKLRKRFVGANNVLTSVSDAVYPWKDLVTNLYDKKLIFHAESNEFKVNFNYSRYIAQKDILIGIQIPVGYKARKLKFDSDITTQSSANITDAYTRTFLHEDFDYILKAKGINYSEKNSITGIGDISAFINFNLHPKAVEKFNFGARIIFPTSKDPSVNKLMAPELGVGFTQISLFGATLFNKQKQWFNPHAFIQATYLLAGHKDKRVPKVITYDGASPADGTVVGASTMAHGDRVKYHAIAFSEPDVAIPAFADNVKTIKIRPGAKFDLRIGNVFEKFLSRRGFLDLFYDFSAKLKDDILNTGLDEDEWQTYRLNENTMKLEHTLGLNFEYQFDIHSRLNLGCKYVFAGINAPQIFNANLGFNVEF
ncbi:hypothetical protein KJ644_04010 [Candidatus Dependentiae bacterium]|nr:hypothetical protein [Candidatus Dependentiae bacterium]